MAQFLDNHTADGFGPMVAAINIGLIQHVDAHSSALTKGCTSGICTFLSTYGAPISTFGVSYARKGISANIRRQK